MAKYLIRAEIDIPEHAEQAWRAELGLTEDAPLLDSVRTAAWEALISDGADTGRWVAVKVT